MRVLTDTDDRELIRLARTDYEAFDVLYRRYVTAVYRYCYARTNSVADAEDITAQTFLAALEGIQRYHGRGSASAWLFGIARHKCADFHRGQYSSRQNAMGDEIEMLADPADEVNPETQVSLRGVLDCVTRCVPMLSPDRLDALRLRYWGGMSLTDIAGVMQRSTAAVKMLISRAISDLRERCVI